MCFQLHLLLLGLNLLQEKVPFVVMVRRLLIEHHPIQGGRENDLSLRGRVGFRERTLLEGLEVQTSSLEVGKLGRLAIDEQLAFFSVEENFLVVLGVLLMKRAELRLHFGETVEGLFDSLVQGNGLATAFGAIPGEV